MDRMSSLPLNQPVSDRFSHGVPVLRAERHIHPAYNKDEWYSLRNGQFILVDNVLDSMNPIFDLEPSEENGGQKQAKPVPFAVNEDWGVKVAFEDLDPAVLSGKQ